jgi:hypothetical protein
LPSSASTTVPQERLDASAGADGAFGNPHQKRDPSKRISKSDDDLSDIGRRCRDIAADAVDAVFQADMIPVGLDPPSRQDAERRLVLEGSNLQLAAA